MNKHRTIYNIQYFVPLLYIRQLTIQLRHPTVYPDISLLNIDFIELKTSVNQLPSRNVKNVWKRIKESQTNQTG